MTSPSSPNTHRHKIKFSIPPITPIQLNYTDECPLRFHFHSYPNPSQLTAAPTAPPPLWPPIAGHQRFGLRCLWLGSVFSTTQVCLLCGWNFSSLWLGSMFFVDRVCLLCGWNFSCLWLESVFSVTGVCLLCGSGLCLLCRSSLSTLWLGSVCSVTGGSCAQAHLCVCSHHCFISGLCSGCSQSPPQYRYISSLFLLHI